METHIKNARKWKIGASLNAMASGSLRRAIDLPDRIKLLEGIIVSSSVTVGAGLLLLQNLPNMLQAPIVQHNPAVNQS